MHNILVSTVVLTVQLLSLQLYWIDREFARKHAEEGCLARNVHVLMSIKPFDRVLSLIFSCLLTTVWSQHPAFKCIM